MLECDEEYIGVSKDLWREVQGTSKGPLPKLLS